MLCVMVVAACGPSPQEPEAARYLQRLGGALGVDLAPVAQADGPPWPLRRDLLVELPRMDIDVVEFFELHGCDLGSLVGFRNSPLGRTQTASQRLGYEAALLGALHRCGAAAPEWLVELGQRKSARLPALYWNALFAGDEFRIAAGASLPEPATDLAVLLRSLRDHREAIGRDAFDPAAFERTLAGLSVGSWVGHARRSWRAWRAHLDAARVALDEQARRVCRNGRPTPRSRILGNVFARYYVAGLQPKLAERMGAHEAWIRELATFADELDGTATPAFRDWFAHVLDPDAPSSEWRRTRTAVVAHAEAWQRLFATCGIDPRSVVGQD